MSDESRFLIVEREVRGMHETLKTVSSEIKELSQSITRFEQQHIRHQELANQNKKDIEALDDQLHALQRDADRLNGSVVVIKWVSGFLMSVLLSAVGWLLSVVMSTQALVQTHQSKIPVLDAKISDLEKNHHVQP